MILIVLFLAVVAVAYRATNPEERLRLLRITRTVIGELNDAARAGRPAREAYRNVLRDRTRWALMTPALLAANVIIFLLMLFGSGAPGDPDTLVRWGANFGPRTTNGEWWRLATSLFVHSGMLHLLVSVAALAQIGLILERLVGSLAFLTVYVTAGISANLLNLSAHPIAVNAGASGSIFGLYGLLLAWSIHGILRRSKIAIPLTVAKRLFPLAIVFLVYSVANGGLSSAADPGAFATGFLSGLVLTSGVSEQKPPARRVAVLATVGLMIALVSAVRLRGIADIRGEIAQIVAMEGRTAGAYKTAFERFRHGRLTAGALAELIDQTIMPELQASDAHLKALERVPPEQQPLLTNAEEYLRLRSDSWRLRAEELRNTDRVLLRAAGKAEGPPGASWRLQTEAAHRANLLALGRAEAAERASWEAFQRISAGQK